MIQLFGFFGGGQRMVESEPWAITNAIASVFAYVIDAIFHVVHSISPANALGISIILMTIVARAAMIPLAVKSQKSMMAMQRLAPEVQKIKDKKEYKDKKDPQAQQKMNQEIQALWAKNKVSPLGGCLPMLLQLPLFVGLSLIMRQSFRYVSRIRELYTEISSLIINQVPQYYEITTPIFAPRVPEQMWPFDTRIAENMNRVLHVLEPEHWTRILEGVRGRVDAGLMSGEYYYQLAALVERKDAIENFFGISTIEAAGLSWPGIIIPILAILTAVATSYLSTQMTVATTDQQRIQQKMMMFMMPIMMGVITIGLPGGVGIFFITSSMFHIAQQAFLNKRAGIPLIRK